MRYKLLSVGTSIKKNGIICTLRIFCVYVLYKIFKLQTFQFKNETINLRSGTSDFPVFREIFMDHEYDLHSKNEIKVIIDLGANIGMSSLYFSKYYPTAVIYALEADKENYKCLLENTKNKTNIIPLHNAIWKEDVTVFIEDLSLHCARSVSENDKKGNPVQGITLGTLIEKYNIPKIDILKVDIEGSEIQLFEYLKKEKQALNKIDIIIIETHDRVTHGCSKAVFDCLYGINYDVFIVGEKFIIKKYK